MTTFIPMTIQRLADHLADAAGTDRRWLLLLEFLEEYGHEPASRRQLLVEAEPATTGDAHWDALPSPSGLRPETASPHRRG